MAGGWFFLIPCEAMTLGEKEYRLPGIGAYMDVAVKKGDSQAMIAALVAMVILIILIDLMIWRPILAWVQRFRFEEKNIPFIDESWFHKAKLIHWILWLFERGISKLKRHKNSSFRIPLNRKIIFFYQRLKNLGKNLEKWRLRQWLHRIYQLGMLCGFIALIYGGWQLFNILIELSWNRWLFLFRDTVFTFLRVGATLIFSTLFAVPVGIWMGTSPRRTRFFQPLVQILASFPAPMLYPLIIKWLFRWKISLNFGSVFLMLLGVQWYVLFNVLAGALKIPRQLEEALVLMKCSKMDFWKRLYLPSIFPTLVTGWITAAGGAWNASIVAEYLFFQGKIIKAQGLGATLSLAVEKGDFPLFAASLSLMVLVVIFLNRTFWAKIYRLAETRFKMEI